MLYNKNNKILFVSSKCMQCGICLSRCKHDALSYVKTSKLWLISIDDEKCVKCESCIKNCPSHWIHEDTVDWERLGKAYLTNSKDEEKQYERSSGGSVFEIAKAFVKSNFGAVYTLYTPPEAKVVNSIEQVEEMPNSVYSPSLWGKNLNLLNNVSQNNILLIGLPCQLKAAKKAVGNFLDKKGKKIFYISLICRKTKDFRYTEYLYKKYGHNIPNVKYLYRGKGWPGKTGCYTDSYSSYSDYSTFSSIPFGLDLWNLKGCYRCSDCLALTCADLSIGDPWLINTNSIGENILIVNTEKGEELLHKANLDIRNINRESALKCLNPSMVRRKEKRVNFYVGVDRNIKSSVKYFLLDAKSCIVGKLILYFGGNRLFVSVLLKIDEFVKSIFR